MLNNNEKEKLEVIEKVLNEAMTRKEAESQLNLSRQQIYRLVKLYQDKGADGFVHGNRGKVNANKKDSKLIEEIERIYLEEYDDYNFTHFYEDRIVGNYDISYDTMRKAFIKDDIISPIANKQTFKNYIERMDDVVNVDNIPEEKIELYETRKLQIEKAHTRRCNNLYLFGQEVQMDASEAIWFGDLVSHLHLAVDKATKKVLGGWFEYEEITRGYYVVLYHIIVNYGIPAMIKADNRSSFSANNAKDKALKNFMTQFGKTCERLNIELRTTSSPTAKANIERLNETFKNRLIAELKHVGITTIDEANEYLNNVFIPKMNKKFSYEINPKTSVMKENCYTEEELKLIISERKDKVIDNASSISYQNKYYVPINNLTGEVVPYSKGTKCTLIINYDGILWGEIENTYYLMLELEDRDTVMKKEKDLPQNKKEHFKYIPPQNHPWRKNMMLR